MKRFFALAFLPIAILIAISSVAFASAPLASKTPFVIDFSDVEFTPEQADFFRRWRDSPYSVLYRNGNSNELHSVAFYIFNVKPLLTTSPDWAGFLLSFDHSGYESVRFEFPNKIYKISKRPAEKTLMADWYPSRPVGSGFVSGSLFFRSDFSPPTNFHYFSRFSEVSIIDNSGIFDGYVSPFPVLPAVTVRYKYADGSRASPTYVKKFAVGSSYSIPSPAIDGYVADVAVVSGNKLTSSVAYDVVYNKITCDILVTYQYEDGSQAFPPFNQTFYEGDSYNIASPPLSGYVPSISLIVGTVSNDTELSMSYNVVYAKSNAIVSSGDFVSFLDTLINFLGIVTLIGCTIFACFLSVRLVVKIIGFFV